MCFPHYRPVGPPEARGFFRKTWQGKIDPIRGLTITEILEAIRKGQNEGVGQRHQSKEKKPQRAPLSYKEQFNYCR
jgi:hypothetical protein